MNSQRILSKELVKLTPEMAAKLLENNPMNRPLSRARAKGIARDIENGLWVVNGQTIVVSDKGVLLDGQHRCLAVVLAGIAVMTFISYGISAEAYATIDGGRSRSMSDIIGGRGVPNAKKVCATVKLMWQYAMGVLGSTSTEHKPSNSEGDELFSKSEGIHDAINFCAKSRHMNSSPVFFVNWVTMKGNKKMAEPFWEAVQSGIGLSKGSPALKLRDTLFYNLNSRQKYDGRDILEFCIRAWVCHLAGHNVQAIRPGILEHREMRNDKGEIVIPMDHDAAMKVVGDSMKMKSYDEKRRRK